MVDILRVIDYFPKAMYPQLSPFYAELLDFINRDVAERIAAEGFDEAADPALRTFQQTMASALALNSTGELLQLSQIIDSYHYLFASRGPLHLEKRLLEAFSSKEQKIPLYRGLPRLYRREQPSDSHVKKNFTHLPTLKELAAEKVIFRLYEKMELPVNAKVSFFTWVIQDGWGDYIAALESIEILRHRFSELQLGWIVFFPKRLGSPPIPQSTKTHLIYYEKEALLSLASGEALEILRTSDLVVQIPTFYPGFDTLVDAVNKIPFSEPPPNWVSIGEYGFIESDWFHPRTGNRSMGLHFLEKGILVKSQPQKKLGFAEIQNEEILQWMFHTISPNPLEIEQYRSANHFYLAYLTTPVGGAVYLRALLKAHQADRKGIDICCPDIRWLVCPLQTETGPLFPLLEIIEETYFELSYQGKIIPLTNRTNGKKIRLLCPSSITPADFHLLVCLSGEFVAVRGDQSFSEVVSANKIFFYDGRAHARYFLKDLLALAENRIGKYKNALTVLHGMIETCLHSLPISSGTWVEETHFQERKPWKEIAWKIGAALQDMECLTGFKKLNQIIAQEHSFNDFLCHLIQRELTHRNHPHIAALEEKAILPFTEGKSGLLKALEDLKTNLAHDLSAG